METSSVYTLNKLVAKDLDDHELMIFLTRVARKANAAYGEKFHWTNFYLEHYVRHHRVVVCYRNWVPVGVMLSRLFPSIFDRNKVILYQDLLFAEKGTRAAKLLFEDFVDYGKSNANHIITMIAEKTNISPRSLEKRGFKKLETQYRLEVK